ncbi:hypothetical protein DL96DRAFT_346424 [Flagelloscypha sp. PMI_526]|nr:hypothetical protein DL96DRAFT_346424 [Flagelloscypha sp. PMI_526]
MSDVHPARTTQGPQLATDATMLRQMLPILCVHAFISVRGRGFSAGASNPLIAALPCLFMAPYWSHIGDIKGRKIPLLVPLLGGLLGSLVTLFEDTRITTFPLGLISGVIVGITGGSITFQAAALA